VAYNKKAGYRANVDYEHGGEDELGNEEEDLNEEDKEFLDKLCEKIMWEIVKASLEDRDNKDEADDKDKDETDNEDENNDALMKMMKEMEVLLPPPMQGLGRTGCATARGAAAGAPVAAAVKLIHRILEAIHSLMQFD
jgi:hypothetical protein